MRIRFITNDGMMVVGAFENDCVDEFDNPVECTKQEYPYSYDGFVTWRGGENKEANNTIYSDRLLHWDYEKTRRLMKKHFDDEGGYYYNRKPKDIEAFLREWTDDPGLKLVFIMEYCNRSNGYPLWRFDCFSPKQVRQG